MMSSVHMLLQEDTKMVSSCNPLIDTERENPQIFSKGVSSSAAEIVKMKDLLLIHLDLIQRQSEQLNKKDQQIKTLKYENVSLHLELNKIIKKREKTGNRTRASTSSSVNNFQVNGRKKQRVRRNSKREGSRSKVLITDKPYYTTIGERDCLWGSDAMREAAKTCKSLEVPSWRHKHYQTSNYTDGIEDLSEEVFEKRHAQYMSKEKRRNKWDIRTIREQLRSQQLKQREEQKKKAPDEKEEREGDSFWPLKEKPITIVISDFTPICVFGLPLPNNPGREFKLPWLLKKGSRTQKSKHRRTK